MVLAGAGSGKTRVLTYRAVWLIEEKGVAAKEIVLLTFTNKAAQEMRERVEKLVMESEKENIALGFAGTFHTFCAKMLRQYGRALDIEPGFVIYDTKDQEDVIKDLGKKMDIPTKNGQGRKVLAFIGKMKNELYTPEGVSSWIKGDYQKNWLMCGRSMKMCLKKARR